MGARDTRSSRSDPHLTQPHLGRINRRRSMRTLVRVDANHHCHPVVSFRHEGEDGPWQACLISDIGARASFEPHHGQDPTG